MEYKLKSPLIPEKDGYPIIIGKGIELEDLETEYVELKGARRLLLPAINPYMMKGAIKLVRASNANSEAEIDEIANQLANNI